MAFSLGRVIGNVSKKANFAMKNAALGPGAFVIGNVVTRGNPLMEAILDRGLTYVSGPQWLRENVLAGKWVVAVAGTHGKTTVSAMLAWILEHVVQSLVVALHDGRQRICFCIFVVIFLTSKFHVIWIATRWIVTFVHDKLL